jgi:predicted phosphodiesterase
MNVLALYDIHGNADALEAVLRAAPTPDVVLVGGDAVPGAFCAATLDRLADLPARWIRGNGEREVAAAVDGPDPAEGDWAAITASITARELGPDRATALGELPLTLELDGVLYCHATPRSDEEILTRLSTPERYADALRLLSASTVVAGHTHQQDDRIVGTIRFLNAGSVGLPYEGDGAARWLWVADGTPSCAAPPTTPRPRGSACSTPAGPTNARSERPSWTRCPRSRSPSSSSSALNQRLRRDLGVGVLDRARDLVPGQPGVELDADPTAVADVRRAEVVLGLAVDERLLHPGRRGAPEREAAIAMVVVDVHHERLLAADEPGWLTVGRAFGDLGQREAEFAHAVQLHHEVAVCQ